jgi:hypothetical protein
VRGAGRKEVLKLLKREMAFHRAICAKIGSGCNYRAGCSDILKVAPHNGRWEIV